ncbi:MAG: response regulator [bacterium]
MEKEKGGAKNRPVQTILVVDDDLEWMNFLSQVLSAEYTVLSASNGEDAVSRAQHTRPAAIILDVMMPGGRDGFSTYAELQRAPQTQNIPVLMLSEVNRKTGLHFGVETMKHYLGKAPAAFLEKPISAERLLDEVKKVLKGVATQAHHPDSRKSAPPKSKKA